MIFITTYDMDGRMLVPKMVGVLSPDTTAPYGRYVEGNYDPDLWWVVLGRAVKRPQNPTNVRDLTLFNIPMPAQLKIDDGRGVTYYDVTDSTVELDFPLPGHYTVTVVTFPYVNATFTFVVPLP